MIKQIHFIYLLAGHKARFQSNTITNNILVCDLQLQLQTKVRFSSYICWPPTRLGLPSLDLSTASSWVSLPTHILPNSDFWISSTSSIHLNTVPLLGCIGLVNPRTYYSRLSFDYIQQEWMAWFSIPKYIQMW